jgi:hypothetical protein
MTFLRSCLFHHENANPLPNPQDSA